MVTVLQLSLYIQDSFYTFLPAHKYVLWLCEICKKFIFQFTSHIVNMKLHFKVKELGFKRFGMKLRPLSSRQPIIASVTKRTVKITSRVNEKRKNANLPPVTRVGYRLRTVNKPTV